MRLQQPPPWTCELWSRLQAARSQGRLPPVLLFTGPHGVGKRRLAWALAESVLCRQPANQGLACGHCPDCHLLAAGHHPDLIQLEPDAEGRSGEITIDAVRLLIGRESLTPTRAAGQVILIDPADRLNQAAANALLKTLEEPTGMTHFILVSEHPDRLPVTIRSRCLRLTIPLPDERSALEWLGAQKPLSDWPLRLRLAQGGPLRALAEAEDADWPTQRDRCIVDFLSLAQGAADPLAVASYWQTVGVGRILEWLIGLTADLLRLGVCSAPPLLAHPDRSRDLVVLAAKLDRAAGHRFLRRLLETRALLDANLNQQLVLESLVIEWSQIGRSA
ncbi:DNA polymerase III subunit delta' [Caldichromatium japonicum]|uniref:DNA polymerase III subunit delta' n=1 Tax=Caldichromatium japonicum TaxID=2699430 RepID=A0A6G7VDZ1_9GAMM|nr:DNA polymerase III subunit delta' [Caldichromatium japonicum]QIK38068.1 DNA polymerase III subunit delta' [Caldichromatium japonicum]